MLSRTKVEADEMGVEINPQDTLTWVDKGIALYAQGKFILMSNRSDAIVLFPVSTS